MLLIGVLWNEKIGIRLLKIIKWLVIVLISTIVLFFIVRFVGQKINTRTPEGGINESVYVDNNETKQWISIYGEDMNNPVLLYLHGGPGVSTSSYSDEFLEILHEIAKLEKAQRGD
jgi:hypothetical protein